MSSPNTTNTPDATVAPTAGQALQVIDILTDAYYTLTEVGQIHVAEDKKDLFPVVFGWWTWITRSSQLVVLAHQNQLGHETAPSVRSIIDHTMVMQWVVDVGTPALDAVNEAGDDNKRKLITSAREAGWALPADITAPAKPATAHPLLATLGNFADLCISYDFRSLYVPYRLLSSSVHPSAQGAAAYVDDHGTLSNGHDGDTDELLVHTALSLILAGRTVSPLMRDDPLVDPIQRAEAAFGASVPLPVRKPPKGTKQRAATMNTGEAR